MKNARWFTWLAVAFLHWMAASPVSATAGPYVEGRFQGRIAYSCDGNHNDPDDWAASPVTLAILAEAGLKERLVHFDYNCILPLTDPEWEKIHAESVLGAAERYGFDKGRFFDCRKDRDGAVASIAKAIDNSTAADPLYFIIAGPMEVDRNDKKASHALNTRLAGGNSGCIRTRFDDLFTGGSASYDVEIRYFDAKDSRCRLALSVNGAAQGAAWESPGEGRGWMSRTIREVAIRRGDEIRLDVRGDDAEAGKLDYVQLNDRSGHLEGEDIR